MGSNGFLYKVWHLYYDGFRRMTVGRTLWAVILIKLFIIFAILKVLFFPGGNEERAVKGREADDVQQQVELHAHR